MWIVTNKGMLSIVQKDGGHIVRARNPEVLEDLFEAKRIVVSDETDYRWRVRSNPNEIKKIMMKLVDQIDYDNFKNSIKDHDLHVAALSIWSAGFRLQEAKSPPKPKPRFKQPGGYQSTLSRNYGTYKSFDDFMERKYRGGQNFMDDEDKNEYIEARDFDDMDFSGDDDYDQRVFCKTRETKTEKVTHITGKKRSKNRSSGHYENGFSRDDDALDDSDDFNRQVDRLFLR